MGIRMDGQKCAIRVGRAGEDRSPPKQNKR